MSRFKKVLWGTAAGYAAMAAAMVASLVLTPMILAYLGKEQYGLWAIFGQLVGYLGITNLGIGNAVAMHVARSARERDSGRISSLVSTGIITHAFFALVFFIAGLIVSHFLPSLFEIPDSFLETAIWAFILTIFAQALSMPVSSLNGILKGFQELAWGQGVVIIHIMVNAFFTVYLLYAGLGLLALPLSALIARSIGFIMNLLKIKKLLPELKIKLSLFNREALKSIFSFSIYSTVFAISVNAIFYTDNIVIGHFLGLELVTVYVLTQKASDILFRIIGLSNNMLRPAYADMHAHRERETQASTFLITVKLTAGAALSASFLFYYLNKDFISIWVGSDHFGGMELTAVFASLLFYHSVHKATAVPLSGALRLKEISLMSILEALINVVLSIILVQYIGLTGVALGTITAGLITSGWYTPLLTCRTIGMDYKSYWTAGILRGILPVLPFGLCLILLKDKFSFVPELIILTVFAMLFTGMFYYTGLQKTERKYLLEQIAGNCVPGHGRS